MGQSIMCRLGRHRWRQLRTEDGNSYVACARCGKEDSWDGSRPDVSKDLGGAG